MNEGDRVKVRLKDKEGTVWMVPPNQKKGCEAIWVKFHKDEVSLIQQSNLILIEKGKQDEERTDSQTKTRFW